MHVPEKLCLCNFKNINLIDIYDFEYGQAGSRNISEIKNP